MYFGSTRINNNFELVDEVVRQAQGTATIFVKHGDEYVRVATNVKKDDGSRAIGTILDPKGKAIESIRKDEPFYGEADILGKPYRASAHSPPTTPQRGPFVEPYFRPFGRPRDSRSISCEDRRSPKSHSD